MGQQKDGVVIGIVEENKIPVKFIGGITRVKVEIQIRTIEMDFWASLEHKIRYKKEINPEDLEHISKELYECAKISNELDLRMQNVRKEIQTQQGERVTDNLFYKFLEKNRKK